MYNILMWHCLIKCFKKITSPSIFRETISRKHNDVQNLVLIKCSSFLSKIIAPSRIDHAYICKWFWTRISPRPVVKKKKKSLPVCRQLGWKVFHRIFCSFVKDSRLISTATPIVVYVFKTEIGFFQIEIFNMHLWTFQDEEWIRYSYVKNHFKNKKHYLFALRQHFDMVQYSWKHRSFVALNLES